MCLACDIVRRDNKPRTAYDFSDTTMVEKQNWGEQFILYRETCRIAAEMVMSCLMILKGIDKETLHQSAKDSGILIHEVENMLLMIKQNNLQELENSIRIVGMEDAAQMWNEHLSNNGKDNVFQFPQESDSTLN